MKHSIQVGWFAGILFRGLEALREDCLRIVDGRRTHTFGNPHGGLSATVVVHRDRFYRRVVSTLR